MNSKNNDLLTVKELRLYFKTRGGIVQAVDGVDFELPRNQATVVIGESGCGKSSLAKAILRLLPRNVESRVQEAFSDFVVSIGHGDTRLHPIQVRQGIGLASLVD